MLKRCANILRNVLAAAAVIALACSVALCAGCGQKVQPGQPDTGQQQVQQGDGSGTGSDDGGGGATGNGNAGDSGGGSGSAASPGNASDPEPPAQAAAIDEDGSYTSKDDVALYIHTYGHLPSNFISKTKARDAGWVSSEGNLDEVCPGKSIGGSRFYNDEGLLPEARGRTWTECDIDYHGGYRGEKRIVFSNDGLIFYTGDHYNTFEQLY